MNTSTIPVRKPDGSIVRMTVDEFRAYQQKLKSVSSQNAPVNSPLQDSKEVVDELSDGGSISDISAVLKSDDAGDGGALVSKSSSLLAKEKKEKQSEGNGVGISTIPVISELSEIKNVLPADLQIKKEVALSPVVSDKESSAPKKIAISPVQGVSSGVPLTTAVSSVVSVSAPVESTPSVNTGGKRTPDDVLKESGVELSPSARGRAYALILSHWRGIRTDDQVVEYAMRAENAGGLSLSAEDAKRFAKASSDASPEKRLRESVQKGATRVSRDALKKVFADKISVWPASGQGASVSEVANMSDLPISEVKNDLVVKSSVVETPEKIEEKKFDILAHLRTQGVVVDDAPVSVKRMVDVVPAGSSGGVLGDEVPKVFGPVDEVRFMTLTDWQRLSPDASARAEKVLKKLQTLKQESFFLYADAAAAWYSSPLMKTYVDMVVRAIQNGQTLAAAAEAGPLSLADCAALTRVGSEK